MPRTNRPTPPPHLDPTDILEDYEVALGPRAQAAWHAVEEKVEDWVNKFRRRIESALDPWVEQTRGKVESDIKAVETFPQVTAYWTNPQTLNDVDYELVALLKKYRAVIERDLRNQIGIVPEKVESDIKAVVMDNLEESPKTRRQEAWEEIKQDIDDYIKLVRGTVEGFLEEWIRKGLETTQREIKMAAVAVVLPF